MKIKKTGMSFNSQILGAESKAMMTSKQRGKNRNCSKKSRETRSSSVLYICYIKIFECYLARNGYAYINVYYSL